MYSSEKGAMGTTKIKITDLSFWSYNLKTWILKKRFINKESFYEFFRNREPACIMLWRKDLPSLIIYSLSS